MKKFMVMFAAMLMVGCAVDTETVSIIKGDKGDDGTSVLCSISELENGLLYSCSNGDSIALRHGNDGENGSSAAPCSVSDTENGVDITCNGETASLFDGSDGQPGQNGTNASVTTALYSSSSCVSIAGSSSYTKPTGSGNRGLYSTSNCASNSKYAEVSQGEGYVVTGTTWLATLTASGDLLVYKF